MKVLHVIDKLETGGAERMLITATALLAEAGVDTDVLLFYRGGPLQAEIHPKVRVHFIPVAGKVHFKALRQIHNVCVQYDIVHIHMRHCYQYVRLAQLMFGGKYKTILHDHYFGKEPDVPLKMRILPPQYYIGVSRFLTTWAVTRLGLKQENVFLLVNTIVPKQVTYTLNRNKKALLISNIRPAKNLELAIALFSKWDWQLDIYGNRAEAAYYNSIKSLVCENPNIRLIENVNNFEHLYPEYNIAIHTAKEESGPLVLLEYMSAGIPFVAFKTGEIAEITQKKLPDLFTDSFEQSEWKAKIESASELTHLPEQLREVFNRNFSAQAYLSECRKIYATISSL